MFTDGRSKRVVFIAHCLLNQNAISDGTAVYPAAFQNIIKALLSADIGIVQLPCPELCCLGLDRGNIHGAEHPVVRENTRIRNEMMKPDIYGHLLDLVDGVMEQIAEYRKYGFEIVGIVGVNRSPSCGVDTTSDFDSEIEGKGLFMEALSNRLKGETPPIPMLGIKGTDSITGRLQSLLQTGG